MTSANAGAPAGALATALSEVVVRIAPPAEIARPRPVRACSAGASASAAPCASISQYIVPSWLPRRFLSKRTRIWRTSRASQSLPPASIVANSPHVPVRTACWKAEFPSVVQPSFAPERTSIASIAIGVQPSFAPQPAKKRIEDTADGSASVKTTTLFVPKAM